MAPWALHNVPSSAGYTVTIVWILIGKYFTYSSSRGDFLLQQFNLKQADIKAGKLLYALLVAGYQMPIAGGW